MSFNRILIAVDGSPIGAHAGAVGLELAQALGAQVGLVSVVDTRVADTIASDVSPSLLLTEAREEARAAVVALRSGEPSRLEFLPEGNPGDEIVKAAKEWPADLIVLGSHGRGGLDRVLLGSIAEAVMRRAPCPVLVVRAKR